MATATSKSSTAQRIKMRLRKGDTVQVISGKDKGKTGEVLRTLPNENRVIVQASTCAPVTSSPPKKVSLAASSPRKHLCMPPT